MKSTLSPLQVGWREWLSLSDLNLSWIKVKVDTGARTSALHAGDIHFFDREGNDWVRFRVRPAVGSHETHDLCEARIIDFREVTDSGGEDGATRCDSEYRSQRSLSSTHRHNAHRPQYNAIFNVARPHRATQGRDGLAPAVLPARRRSLSAPGNLMKIGVLSRNPKLYSTSRFL